MKKTENSMAAMSTGTRWRLFQLLVSLPAVYASLDALEDAVCLNGNCELVRGPAAVAGSTGETQRR